MAISLILRLALCAGAAVAIAAPAMEARALDGASPQEIWPLAERAPALEGAVEGLLPQLPEFAASGPAFALDDVLPTAIRMRLERLEKLHPRLSSGQRERLIGFYEARGFAAQWIEGSQERPVWNARAQAVRLRLAAAGEDALEPAHYTQPPLGVVSKETLDDLAQAELSLSLAAILYARDARGARIDVTRLSKHITPKLEIPDADTVLETLAAAFDPGAALADYNPPHRGYALLREQLADLRLNRPTRPVVHIPEGPNLREGMRDPRVPLIRARFGVAPDENVDERLYDRQIALAVQDFQRENGLAVDGIIGRQTMAALLAEDPARREGDIIANMERWRWLPRDLGERAIVVNTPEFVMRVFDGGELVHEARAVVGRPDAPTPIFSDRMNHIVVNPSWTIPPSILRNEVLPGLRADPDYADRKGYEVIREGANISVRQPPGPTNPLGAVKFMFPNKHHVYLHDTPARGLFDTLRRAHSAGCVRIENPFRLADLLLAEAGWGEARLRGLLGDRERTVRISPAVPVHLTYFTMSVAEDGQLRAFEDIYGFNQNVRDALGL